MELLVPAETQRWQLWSLEMENWFIPQFTIDVIIYLFIKFYSKISIGNESIWCRWWNHADDKAFIASGLNLNWNDIQKN